MNTCKITAIKSFITFVPRTHPQGKAPLAVSETSLGDSISKFDSRFYPKVSGSHLSNIIYSPFSLHMALYQTFLGSPKGSDTHSELGSLLQIDQEDDSRLIRSYFQARQDLGPTL